MLHTENLINKEIRKTAEAIIKKTKWKKKEAATHCVGICATNFCTFLREGKGTIKTQQAVKKFVEDHSYLLDSTPEKEKQSPASYSRQTVFKATGLDNSGQNETNFVLADSFKQACTLLEELINEFSVLKLEIALEDVICGI